MTLDELIADLRKLADSGYGSAGVLCRRKEVVGAVAFKSPTMHAAIVLQIDWEEHANGRTDKK